MKGDFWFTRYTTKRRDQFFDIRAAWQIFWSRGDLRKLSLWLTSNFGCWLVPSKLPSKKIVYEIFMYRFIKTKKKTWQLEYLLTLEEPCSVYYRRCVIPLVSSTIEEKVSNWISRVFVSDRFNCSYEKILQSKCTARSSQ